MDCYACGLTLSLGSEVASCREFSENLVSCNYAQNSVSLARRWLFLFAFILPIEHHANALRRHCAALMHGQLLLILMQPVLTTDDLFATR